VWHRRNDNKFLNNFPLFCRNVYKNAFINVFIHIYSFFSLSNDRSITSSIQKLSTEEECVANNIFVKSLTHTLK